MRITLPLQAVVGALLQQPDEEKFGLEIAEDSGLEPAVIYGVLQRLRTAGWVEDRWEDAEIAHREGRPPRRYYRLSPEGRARGIHALQKGRDRSRIGRLLTPPAIVPTSERGPT
ncbi:MAG: PadR family transcriptional regulator [Pseudonocardiaceae bacterium]